MVLDQSRELAPNIFFVFEPDYETIRGELYELLGNGIGEVFTIQEISSYSLLHTEGVGAERFLGFR